MIFECAFDDNQVLLLQVLAFLKRSKEKMKRMCVKRLHCNFITMTAIYIPVSKCCDSSCYKVCRMINFGNDLDLYIKKGQGDCHFLKIRTKNTCLLLICFVKRRNLHSSA